MLEGGCDLVVLLNARNNAVYHIADDFRIRAEDAVAEFIGRIEGLDADLQQMLIEFVALAQAQPETAKRHLAFAVGELRSASQGR